MLMNIIVLAQLAATLVVGVYFFRQMRAQSAPERAAHSGGKAQAEWKRLNALRRIHLSEPLSEQARPTRLEDIVGQGDAVEALMAVLSGPHPQHVLIYGPPGVGKTCAARLALQAAKHSEGTPFLPDAPFIEMDATCVRFDERAIADPLIGSVHDPIYQGAGQLGASGVPQPKEGAVTRAHGGVLFLDEIGELHPVQMNKLLKVLEDRVVRFESAYYDPNDSATPRWIHDVFHNGMPADFRLVGATTRAPSELPAALRSRCIEIFFRALEPEELATIAQSAAERLGFAISSAEAAHIGRYAGNGREAVNMVQMAAAVARRAGRRAIGMQDVQWVVDCGRYAPRHAPGRSSVPGVGVVNGLAVSSAGEGLLLPIEAVCAPGRGRVTIAGIVEEEELSDGRGRKIRRMSMARGAAENAVVLLKNLGYPTEAYDLHLNFPGGAPVDGPSAGVAMAIAMASALANVPVTCDIAVTGEISARGRVLPVGGVRAKARAAAKAGLERLILPAANAAEALDAPIRACPVSNIKEVFALAMGEAALDAPSQEMAEPFFSQARVPAQKKIAAHAAEEGGAPSEGKEDGVPI